MSRAEQAERAMDREMEYYERAYEAGEISIMELRKIQVDLQRDLRAAYEEDCYEAQQAVNDEWGIC